MSEKKIIDQLIRSKDSREIKYIGLVLLTEEYKPEKLARLAEENDLQTRLGYLSDVVTQAAEKMGLNTQKTRRLSTLLYNTPQNWIYLDPHLPDFAKRIVKKSSQTALNDKWKIYSNLNPKDIEDWIDLYIVRKHATSPRR